MRSRYLRGKLFPESPIMLNAYITRNNHLVALGSDDDLGEAMWIDLFSGTPEQIAQVEALGISVPTLAEMEEIEISNRLYREGEVDVMTVVLPGLSEGSTPVASPVTFILTPQQLVTVRHRISRPFETYPQRPERTAVGCATHERIFLGLIEEIVGRLADLLEGIGISVDDMSANIYRNPEAPDSDELLEVLRQVGRQGDLLGRIRLGLTTCERMLSYYVQNLTTREDTKALKHAANAQTRDIQALAVHADFLGSRIGLTTDATLGMVNLAQNAAVRIISVVAALFTPPTLIASIYGMNFANMPELQVPWAYPVALAAMLTSAVATWAYFRWRGWL